MELLKKSIVCAFAIVSGIFTFVPENIFGKVALIPEFVLEIAKLNRYFIEINIIVNRIITFIIVENIVVIIYIFYLKLKKSIRIKGNNYEITVEYGDLLKTKKCKRVINFDECFSTNIGETPADVKETSSL